MRDRRVRTLLYEAANVMLTRYKGQLKLKDWAFAIAKRSTMRKARIALARRGNHHARDERRN
jgi:transposase